MEEVIKLNAVDQYNKMFGLETLHPLVSVVDLSEATGGNLIVAPPAVHYTHNVPTGLAQEGENVIIKLFLYTSTSGGFGPAAPEPGRDWQQLPA